MLRAAAIFFAAAAICILSIALSPSYQECIAQGSQQKSTEPSKESYAYLERTGVVVKCVGSFIEAENAVVTALATVAIAIFTVFLVIVTERQANLTRDTARLAREEFNATHRPKIKIHAAELKRIPPEIKRDEADDWGRLGADLICFNVGESTALRVEVRGQILAGAGFAIDVQRPLVKKIDEVSSGQKFRAEIRCDVPMHDVAMGRRTGIDYHCVGWIAYWDQNGLRRETGFCFPADPWDKQRERWVSAEKPEYEYDY
jgi:hypothetical protein